MTVLVILLPLFRKALLIGNSFSLSSVLYLQVKLLVASGSQASRQAAARVWNRRPARDQAALPAAGGRAVDLSQQAAEVHR